MNHKTIRAYQFKADEAVRTLEEAGAQWVVGKGKPHWVLPIEPKVDVEEVKRQQAVEFAKIVDKNFIGMCRELFGEPQVDLRKDVPVVDAFEHGPMHFPERHRYINTIAEIVKIPSWHKLDRGCIGHHVHIADIAVVSKTNYKGYAAVFQVGSKTAWMPLSCIKFTLKY